MRQDNMYFKKNIVAIIVTYCPNLVTLEQLIKVVRPQVNHLVVVDNSSGETSSICPFQQQAQDLIWLPQGQNIGLAAAQNLGIAQARTLSADYVLLLDQDSLPAQDMVEQLLKVAEKIAAGGVPPAAVGPRYTDSHREARPFPRLEGLRIKHLRCQNSSEALIVDHLITSGSLVPVSVLDRVGDLCEELFIDFVDIEWSLRAKAAGYISYGVCSAQMHHSLGEEPVRFLGRNYCMHSAIRHYYQIRNSIWMVRRSWLPWGWRVTIFRQMLLKYVFYTLFSHPQIEHFRLMTLGLWHGIIGLTGKLEQPY